MRKAPPVGLVLRLLHPSTPPDLGSAGPRLSLCVCCRAAPGLPVLPEPPSRVTGQSGFCSEWRYRWRRWPGTGGRGEVGQDLKLSSPWCTPGTAPRLCDVHRPIPLRGWERLLFRAHAHGSEIKTQALVLGSPLENLLPLDPFEPMDCNHSDGANADPYISNTLSEDVSWKERESFAIIGNNYSK